MSIVDINASGKRKNILIDASNLFYRTAFWAKDELMKTAFMDWSIFRHSILEMIIKEKSRYQGDVRVILCYDQKVNGDYWRNKFFEGYKEHRQKQKSDIPKDIMIKEFKEMRKILEENVPYYSIGVDMCEADDVIAILSQYFKDDMNIILSPDHDFQQLLIYPNVYLYDWSKKQFIICEDPKKFKFEHVLMGDTGDGIRNIFSSLQDYNPMFTSYVKEKGFENVHVLRTRDTELYWTFVKEFKEKYPDSKYYMLAQERQKPLGEKKANEMWYYFVDKGADEFRAKYIVNEDMQQRFIDNRMLVDFTYIPEVYQQKIKTVFDATTVKGSRKSFYDYCIKNRFGILMELAQNI